MFFNQIKIEMKKILQPLLFIGVLLLFDTAAVSQTVSEKDARKVAGSFLNYRSSSHQVEAIESVYDADDSIAHVVHLSPTGFILVSNNRLVSPVIAYSFESNWHIGGEEEIIFQTLMIADLRCKMNYPDISATGIQKVDQLWSDYLSGNLQRERFEQWPPEGTTPTGGWLEANWTQNAPYNTMCPIDPNTHQRGLAGCPAVAMAMIVNYLKEINGTRLNDGDDYYHNFGANNKFWIDNDWQAHGFPYFDSLNLYLDTIEYNYQQQKPIGAMQKAALNFACGTALKQVYSSSVSGTYGMSQAGVAYQRFGFEDSRLVLSPDTLENANLAENIKNGLIAHLGLVDPGVTVGHNVVVDGYNTDEFFHFNFGWGGSANGWYTMPPLSAPYNLTVIEGIVLDIFKGSSVGINQQFPVNRGDDASIQYFGNIFQIDLSEPKNGVLDVDFISPTGQVLHRTKILTTQGQHRYEINAPVLNTGLLLITLTDNQELFLSKKLVIIN